MKGTAVGETSPTVYNNQPGFAQVHANQQSYSVRRKKSGSASFSLTLDGNTICADFLSFGDSTICASIHGHS